MLNPFCTFFFILYLYFEDQIFRELQDKLLGALTEYNFSIRYFISKLMKKMAYRCSVFSFFAFEQSCFSSHICLRFDTIAIQTDGKCQFTASLRPAPIKIVAMWLPDPAGGGRSNPHGVLWNFTGPQAAPGKSQIAE